MRLKKEKEEKKMERGGKRGIGEIEKKRENRADFNHLSKKKETTQHDIIANRSQCESLSEK